MSRFHQRMEGFTLIELLVAVSITLVLSAIMVRVTIDVLSLWQRTQDRHTQLVAAKQMLDTLERDLHTIVWRRDSTIYLAAEILDTPSELDGHGWLTTAAGPLKPASGGSLLSLPSVDPLHGVPLLSSARFGLSGVWFRFIASNVESGGTLPTLVSYKISRRPVTGNPTTTNAAPVRYSLYRSAISTSETFGAGYDVTSSNYSSSTNNPSSITTTVHRNRSNAMNPSHANLIASNVVDFGCWFYRRNSDGALELIFPGGVGDKSHLASGDSTADPSRMPDVVDVFIRILSEQGATLIDGIESGRATRPAEFSDDGTWWWAVVEKNSITMTRRIALKGGAL